MMPGQQKQKYLRFFQHGVTACATVFGPICFTPCPLLVFKGDPSSSPSSSSSSGSGSGSAILVGTGTRQTVEAERIICKKVVLTGFPFKIHKTRTVIRGMFLNPEDVEWFKPVELTTKLGRVGTIEEAVGTHGRFKAHFDDHLKAHDVVCLNLFKRVFPKMP